MQTKTFILDAINRLAALILIQLFSNDALHWSNMTVNVYDVITIFVSNNPDKMCITEVISHTFFSLMINAPNQHIRMISEKSRDTED